MFHVVKVLGNYAIHYTRDYDADRGAAGCSLKT